MYILTSKYNTLLFILFELLIKTRISVLIPFSLNGFATHLKSHAKGSQLSTDRQKSKVKADTVKRPGGKPRKLQGKPPQEGEVISTEPVFVT